MAAGGLQRALFHLHPPGHHGRAAVLPEDGRQPRHRPARSRATGYRHYVRHWRFVRELRDSFRSFTSTEKIFLKSLIFIF